MPQVSFEFLQIASLSRRRHGFDSRTGRQNYQSFTKDPIFAEGPIRGAIKLRAVRFHVAVCLARLLSMVFG